MSKLTTAIATLGVVAGLGVAALPLSSYAVTSDTANTAVKATVEGDISITSDATDNTVDLGTVTPGAALSATNQKDVVYTINTNSTNGYKVTIVGSGDGTNKTSLYSGANEIPTGVPAQNTSAWGIKASKASGAAGNINSDFANVFAAVPATAREIFTNGSKSADGTGDSFAVTYGITAAPGQASGEYTGKVTLTATVNS